MGWKTGVFETPKVNVCIKNLPFSFAFRLFFRYINRRQHCGGGWGGECGSAMWKMKTLRHDSELFLFFPPLHIAPQVRWPPTDLESALKTKAASASRPDPA